MMDGEVLTVIEHECVFVEEQEPSGRLVLPPCIVCGLTAMDALEQQRMALDRVKGLRDQWQVRYGAEMPGVEALDAALVGTQPEMTITCAHCGADVLAQGYACCPDGGTDGRRAC